jgi:hypothetical protein
MYFYQQEMKGELKQTLAENGCYTVVDWLVYLGPSNKSLSAAKSETKQEEVEKTNQIILV